MLRFLLPLLSSLQIGARIKQSIQIYVREAIVIAIAAVILVFALLFGLLALYHALTSVWEFTPLESAGIVGAGLTVLALLVLATIPLVTRVTKEKTPSMMTAPAEGLGMLEQGVGKAMNQTSPLTLLAVAFVAGLFAGRR
jgi:ABC-type antimicrobial peptide transport system permease subunit